MRFSMFVAVLFSWGWVGVLVWLGLVFLSKDGPDEEEGREKLN